MVLLLTALAASAFDAGIRAVRPMHVCAVGVATGGRHTHLLRMASDGTRDALKQSLICSARGFRSAQEEWWAQQSSAPGGAPLQAESFANKEVEMDTSLQTMRDRTIELVQQLAAANPTEAPFAGWRTQAGSALLEGTWELLFTTGADATFRSSASSAASTYQQIDSRKGHFTNCVDFGAPDAKLRGFRVLVAGYPLSDTEVALKFRRVTLLRRSRWFKTLVFPLPPSFVLRAAARWGSKGRAALSNRGAGFRMLYLDDDLRCHVTFDGQYFVQRRKEAAAFSYDAAQEFF
uniref:Plastid lipid-associated protein/fibrillin conserved domain-containing protein n=1 Tax=Calcidiscus leptoporus TaxID=127549 RepID=A0A7S0JGZ7_9EUKA